MNGRKCQKIFKFWPRNPFFWVRNTFFCVFAKCVVVTANLFCLKSKCHETRHVWPLGTLECLCPSRSLNFDLGRSVPVYMPIGHRVVYFRAKSARVHATGRRPVNFRAWSVAVNRQTTPTILKICALETIDSHLITTNQVYTDGSAHKICWIWGSCEVPRWIKGNIERCLWK